LAATNTSATQCILGTVRDLSVDIKGQRSKRLKAALILGAGWSRSAGLPLASQLFSQPPRDLLSWTNFPVREVPEAFRQWRLAHPDSTAEQFIGHLYKRPFMFELPGEYFPFHSAYDSQLHLPEAPEPPIEMADALAQPGRVLAAPPCMA
jgi:hypothetical protein